MDYVLVSDLARGYVVVVASWLALVLLRLTYTRTKDCGGVRCLLRNQSSPHPFSTLGLAVLLFVDVLHRFDRLGQPGDYFLWLVAIGVTLVLLGVLVNVRFDVRVPWRRR